MCLLANTPFRLLQFEAFSTRNGVAYPKKQSKYDSLLGVFVAVGIQASRTCILETLNGYVVYTTV